MSKYTKDEIKLLFDYSKSDKEIGLLLGRTEKSVREKRFRCRKKRAELGKSTRNKPNKYKIRVKIADKVYRMSFNELEKLIKSNLNKTYIIV